MMSSQPVSIRREWRGAAAQLMRCRDREVLIAGPAGTGKSLACLEKLNRAACKYPGMRGLMARKTRASMTQTTLITFERKVAAPRYGAAWRSQEQEFVYPNGSVIAVAGLDKPSRLMSSEYDLAYVAEATELHEDDWESLTTRLRNGVMPYQQLVGDCNPGPPHHWLKQRADAGRLTMLESRHDDNPSVTQDYLATLDALSGVRKERLRYGRWAAAEGMIYSEYDPRIHLLDRAPITDTWQRWLAIDFGYTNPFVCQWWAEDPDGRLYLYREIYRTRQLVEDLARRIATLSAGEKIAGVIGDHDAEDRATFERHTGWRIKPADKSVRSGIQAVMARLKVQPDGKPRLFFVRDAVVERDPALVEAKRPSCTVEELEGYVWQGGASVKEEPVKEDDHGMDAARYVCMARGGKRSWGVAA